MTLIVSITLFEYFYRIHFLYLDKGPKETSVYFILTIGINENWNV